DGIRYGPIEATLDREQGANIWLTIGIREGKNREVRKVLENLSLRVNRLIRVAFGPFDLGELEEGANIWLTIGIREGKNREVRKVLENLSLRVNRLIRVAFGPFDLGELE